MHLPSVERLGGELRERGRHGAGRPDRRLQQLSLTLVQCVVPPLGYRHQHDGQVVIDPVVQHSSELVNDFLSHPAVASPHQPETGALNHAGPQGRTSQLLLIGAQLQRQGKGQGNGESDGREDQFEVLREKRKEGAPPSGGALREELRAGGSSCGRLMLRTQVSWTSVWRARHCSAVRSPGVSCSSGTA